MSKSYKGQNFTHVNSDVIREIQEKINVRLSNLYITKVTVSQGSYSV